MERTEPTSVGDNDGKTTFKIMNNKKFKFFRGKEKKGLVLRFEGPGVNIVELSTTIERNRYTPPTGVTATQIIPNMYFFSGTTAFNQGHL